MSYLVREPDALIGPVRFDEREVETGHGREIEAPANERAGYRWTRPKPPRHFSTLLRIGSNATGWARGKTRFCVTTRLAICLGTYRLVSDAFQILIILTLRIQFTEAPSQQSLLLFVV